MTTDQKTIDFIRTVIGLKNKIANSQSKDSIIEAVNEVINLSQKIFPRTITLGDGTKYTDFEGKEKEIKTLESAIEYINDGTYNDFKTIHIQVQSTIISLLITLFHLTIDEIDKISASNH